jgi:hypothetical protein
MADPYYVTISFPCVDIEMVRPIAQRYREQLAAAIATEEAYEVTWFLESLIAGHGFNDGPKGGMITWGIVTNKLIADDVVHLLRPFWEETLTLGDQALMIYQQDEGDGTYVYQIGWDGIFEKPMTRRLAIRHFGPFPFSWSAFTPLSQVPSV